MSNNHKRLYALLADIHGNYVALKAVVRDARKVADKEGFGSLQFICLGDVVDYGPQPNECMAWIRRYARLWILGNHDKEAAAGLYEPVLAVDEEWWPITLWTRRVLKSAHKSVILSWRTQWVSPRDLELEAFTFFHGSLTGYKETRIDYVGPAWDNFPRLHTTYGFFGHTHIQSYFTEGVDEPTTTMYLPCPEERQPKQITGWQTIPLGTWEPLPFQRALFNPGSVGLPSPHAAFSGTPLAHDCRAAYMLLQVNGSGRGAIQYRRVRYEVNKTVDLLRERVRWPETPAGNGSSIYRNGLAKQVRNSLEHINETLPALVEGRLIPALECR
jgi:predicted phosphodiesterase